MLVKFLKKITNAAIVPLVLIKRYINAKNETALLKSVNHSLSDIHLKNTRLLADRNELLEVLGKKGVVAEVGVATGDFSNAVLRICQPVALHLIDYWKKNKNAHGISPVGWYSSIFNDAEQSWDNINSRFKQEIVDGIIILHRGYSWDMLELLPDQSLDWVYIDAAHDFISVARDLEVARRKIKVDGIIAGHDYVRWSRFGYRCGVVEAVNEFCIKHHYELIYLTHDARTTASFAISKIKS